MTHAPIAIHKIHIKMCVLVANHCELKTFLSLSITTCNRITVVCKFNINKTIGKVLTYVYNSKVFLTLIIFSNNKNHFRFSPYSTLKNPSYIFWVFPNLYPTVWFLKKGCTSSSSKLSVHSCLV